MIKIEKTCGMCGKRFETYEVNGSRCAECNDRRKNHMSENVTKERKCIETHIVRNFLPESRFTWWRTGDYKDMAALRWTVKGQDYGWGAPYASWQGRLDVWVNFRTPTGQAEEIDRAERKYPKVVRFRLMETRKAAPSSQPALSFENVNGIVETLPRLDYSDTWQYVALDPLPDETTESEIEGGLHFKTASYKSTLKGLGAQWSEDLNASDALWHVDFFGACRSARYGSNSSIFIANERHPVIWKDRDGEVHRIPEERIETL